MLSEERVFILQALTLNVQCHHLLRRPSLVLSLACQIAQVVFGGDVAEVKDQLHSGAPDSFLTKSERRRELMSAVVTVTKAAAGRLQVQIHQSPGATEVL